MKDNLRVIIFVIVMSLFTSGIIIGVEALTSERIQNNQDAKIKIAILEANDIPYALASINDTFDEEMNIVNIDDWTFYVNPDTGSISFEISGNGVWGPIEGILTLEDDFQTIINVSILQQEETPGLGGVLAEPQYLETFVGKIFNPDFQLNKDPGTNADNEIDAITGATNTSKRFQEFLNDDYEQAKIAWQSQNE
ncbi:FMN-binding protein [Mycoplasmatota bacterium]|nr:FMN-binding protein [Mycoplasmatota bacterium]